MRNGGLPATVDILNHRLAAVALGEEKQCLFLIGNRRKSTGVRTRRPKSPALPGNVCAAIQTIAVITVSSRIRNLILF
jgi:hypothetical protein